MNTQILSGRLPWRSGFLVLIGIAGLILAGCGDSEQVDGSADHADHAEGDEMAMAGFIGVNHTHDDPSETCFICDPSKRDKSRLWCREHGRYEDRCWMCHPELEDKDRLYCKEHALYEDECFLCHPELKASGGTEDPSEPSAEVAPADVSGDLFCKEHGVYERECGICQPDLASSLQPGDSLKVRFLSGKAAEKAGIALGSPGVGEMAPSIPVYCETRYNGNELARITPLVGGVVREVHKDLGERVSPGEPLVDLHSSAVADAKSAYLSALVRLEITEQAYQRLERLDAENIAATKDLIKAEGEYRTARFDANRSRQRLINLGLPPEEVKRVEEEQDTSSLLTVRAPFGGTLVARHAVVGEAVEAGHELFTLAELSKFWVELSIPPAHLGQVRLGQTVDAIFSELGDQPFSGRITWIDSSIDRDTRMVRARAVVDPGDRPMSAGLFGKAYIIIGASQNGAILPKAAVQRYEGSDFVFVREADDLFSLRRVELGAERDGRVEVLKGIRPDEQVVVDGSFIAMSEFLKFRLGAGCVH